MLVLLHRTAIMHPRAIGPVGERVAQVRDQTDSALHDHEVDRRSRSSAHDHLPDSLEALLTYEP